MSCSLIQSPVRGDNYLTLLEKRLAGVEVYNFGVASAGPREYLSILRRDVWTYQPDLVLASVFVGNDITETLATPRHLDPQQHALYLLCHRSWRLVWGRGHQGRRPLRSIGESVQCLRKLGEDFGRDRLGQSRKRWG